MAKILLLSVLIIGFSLCASTQARAQAFISPLIGYDFGGDATCPNLTGCQDKKINYSVSLGAMGRVFGFEEEFAYAPDFFGTKAGLSSNVLTLMSNVMLAPKIGLVRPYLEAGLGLVKTHVDLTTTTLFTTDNNNLGWDFGGGLMFFLGDHFAVRGDLRYIRAFQDLTVQGFTLGSSKLDFGRASGGVVLKF
jgi:opacity protein-like surface antigen